MAEQDAQAAALSLCLPQAGAEGCVLTPEENAQQSTALKPQPALGAEQLSFFVSLTAATLPLEAAQVSLCSLLPSQILLLLSLDFANFSHAFRPDPGNS